jgi:phage gp36-like protein
MPQITPEQLLEVAGEDKFLRLVDKSGDGVMGSEELKAVQKALGRAEGLADSLIGTKYTKLPDDEVPDVLLGFLADVTFWYLADDSGPTSEQQRQRFEDAKRWMKAVGKGDAQLGNESNTAPLRTTAAVHAGPDRKFTVAQTKGLL